MSDEPKRPVILESLRSKQLLKSREITNKVQEALQQQVPVPASDKVSFGT